MRCVNRSRLDKKVSLERRDPDHGLEDIQLSEIGYHEIGAAIVEEAEGPIEEAISITSVVTDEAKVEAMVTGIPGNAT